MAVRRLFDNLEIDWQRLKLPACDRHGDDPPGATPCPRAVRPEDLASIRALLKLYRRAVARGVMPECEGSLIAFLATAAYCRRVGEKPAVLLAYCLRNRAFPATLADEDRACAALKAYRAELHPPGAWLKACSPSAPGPNGPSRP